VSADVISAELATESGVVGRRRGGWRSLLSHLLWMLATLFFTSVVVFAATQILPGDPAELALGKNATPESLAALRQQLNLDEPVIAQYWDWLRGVLSGDLGTSISARIPVSDLIGNRIVNTATLVGITSLIILPLSLLFGIVGAVRRDRAVDHGLAAFAIVFTAVPDFVVGMVLLMVFATSVFTVFPAVSLIPDGANPLGYLDEMALPILTLTLVSLPYLGRLLRASMIDILQSEYVAWARLKGTPERQVILRHALPNALVPLIQGYALILAYLSGGIVVIEYLFAFPGLGSALLAAVHTRDIPVVQAICLIFAAFYVVVNLVADALCVLVTPRLRTKADS